MKKETAIAAVAKNGKKGTKAYTLVMDALERGFSTIRPCNVTGRGRFATNLDYTSQVCALLDACKIKYIRGNDAPRGGLTGNYIILTHVG